MEAALARRLRYAHADRAGVSGGLPPARSEARSSRAGTAWVFTARLECKGGLAGQTIAIEGLEAFVTDVLVRVQHTDENVETHVLKPTQPSITLRAAGDTRRGVGAYLYLGIEHILLGVDHLLFVLGLLLIVRDRWMLVKTVTAFTIAHSITLAVATFGYAQRAGGAAPNAAIALSILFLGPEIVRAGAARQASRSATRGWSHSRSDCCTVSASRAVLARSDCPSARSRSRC